MYACPPIEIWSSLDRKEGKRDGWMGHRRGLLGSRLGDVFFDGLGWRFVVWTYGLMDLFYPSPLLFFFFGDGWMDVILAMAWMG